MSIQKQKCVILDAKYNRVDSIIALLLRQEDGKEKLVYAQASDLINTGFSESTSIEQAVQGLKGKTINWEHHSEDVSIKDIEMENFRIKNEYSRIMYESAIAAAKPENTIRRLEDSFIKQEANNKVTDEDSDPAKVILRKAIKQMMNELKSE